MIRQWNLRKGFGMSRKIAPCNTVAMHGAPFSRFDNRKLLNISHLLKFDLSADAVISFCDENLSYFTDTGEMNVIQNQ